MHSEGDLRLLCDEFRKGMPGGLRSAIEDVHPADIADAMRYLSDEEDLAVYRALNPEEAAEVLDEVDAATRRRLVADTTPERLAEIVAHLPSDEAADIIGTLPKAAQQAVLDRHPEGADVRDLLAYPPETAGGIMTHGYVDCLETETVAESIARFRTQATVERIFDLYVVTEDGHFVGAVDLHTLLRAAPETRMDGLADASVACVPPEMDQERVAAVFARYDLTALPVVDVRGRLLGVVTADDVIDVVIQEADEDVAHLSGTDAAELEKKSPARIALMRMPWLLATMFIELFAGKMVGFFNHTLSELLVLASFMPVISAISGNTGLQSAAIIIRGLSSGTVQMAHWRHAVVRQVSTTAILATACGLAIGLVGALGLIGTAPNHRWAFGALVAVGMFASMNIAGTVGTLIPLLSKRLGFDPALTAGPFETAFQDVIGISIFLGMATLLLPYLR